MELFGKRNESCIQILLCQFFCDGQFLNPGNDLATRQMESIQMDLKPKDSVSPSKTTDPFVTYYEKQSESQESLYRSKRVKTLILRVRKLHGQKVSGLKVADIGCNAGTQSLVWASDNHSISGLDINEALLEIAKKRFSESGFDGSFVLGSAVDLPWEDESMDVCLLPELLEHVPEWTQCLDEAARVLKPGGVVYISTTNWLCPRQMEFDLPMYSWFPPALKRHYEKLSVTTRPELVNHAKYPAVNWFTPYSLKNYLRQIGMNAFDHFEVSDPAEKGGLGRAALWTVQNIGLAKLAAHIATSYSIVLGVKR